MTIVYVALGSNLDDPHRHLLEGSQDINRYPECEVLKTSSIYETSPMGPQDQPHYLNSVAKVQCRLEPLELLRQLKLTEQRHGRAEVSERWTARPLDLDILLFGKLQLHTDRLQIPHPGIADRSFVLWPLAELEPNLDIPVHGNIQELMWRCPKFGIRKYIAHNSP